MLLQAPAPAHVAGGQQQEVQHGNCLRHHLLQLRLVQDRHDREYELVSAPRRGGGGGRRGGRGAEAAQWRRRKAAPQRRRAAAPAACGAARPPGWPCRDVAALCEHVCAAPLRDEPRPRNPPRWRWRKRQTPGRVATINPGVCNADLGVQARLVNGALSCKVLPPADVPCASATARFAANARSATSTVLQIPICASATRPQCCSHPARRHRRRPHRRRPATRRRPPPAAWRHSRTRATVAGAKHEPLSTLPPPPP